jgi:uncharacterized DUF497 family protein
VATIEYGDFEWDDAKAPANEKKHGVTFVEAVTVFEDVDFLVNADPSDVSRFIAVGFSSDPRRADPAHLDARCYPSGREFLC